MLESLFQSIVGLQAFRFQNKRFPANLVKHLWETASESDVK